MGATAWFSAGECSSGWDTSILRGPSTASTARTRKKTAIKSLMVDSDLICLYLGEKYEQKREQCYQWRWTSLEHGTRISYLVGRRQTQYRVITRYSQRLLEHTELHKEWSVICPTSSPAMLPRIPPLDACRVTAGWDCWWCVVGGALWERAGGEERGRDEPGKREIAETGLMCYKPTTAVEDSQLLYYCRFYFCHDTKQDMRHI